MEDNRGVLRNCCIFSPHEHCRDYILCSSLPIYPFSCSSTCTVSERDQINAERFWLCPFADEISLQWVPVGGIAVKLSCPGAEQPFLQGPAPLSDSSRRGEMMVMPARAFDFLSISLCFHTALLIADRPHFVSLLKDCFENALFVMWSPRWGWQKDTNPLFYPESQYRLWWFLQIAPSSFSSPEAQITPPPPPPIGRGHT